MEIVSVLVAIATYLFTHYNDKRKEKVQKTVELLMPFTTSDRLAKGNVLVSTMITNDKTPILGESKEVDESLIDLLDYYEFLCELLEREVADKETVLQLRGRLLGKTYSILLPFIEQLRIKHGRGVYSGIRTVVEKYKLNTDSPILSKA
jgi:hypothetical protein